jgi:hypothetical protein
MIFTILRISDKSGGVDAGKVPLHIQGYVIPLIKHHALRAYGECTCISSALVAGEE